MTKFSRLQPEYMGTRRVRVTVCNVPTFFTGEILALFLSAFGRVEDVLQLWSAAGTANGDYVFQICLTSHPRYHNQPGKINDGGVRGKQIDHLTKACPLKNIQTTDTTKEKPLKEADIEVSNPAPELEDSPCSENEWTQIN